MKATGNKSTGFLAMTVSDFLQDGGRGAELLRSLGLPVQGNEERTLMEVCTAHQKNETEVLEQINRFKNETEFKYPEGIFSWSPELVVRYLEEEHHKYTKSLMQDTVEYGNRAWDVHGTQYEELNQVKWYVSKLQNKLEMHLKFEEQKFFPMVIRFFEMNGETKDGVVQSLRKQAEIIKKDQEEIEYFIERLKTLTNKFTPPKEACTTFRLLYANLKKLDEDLQKHHFLEEQYVLSKLESKFKELLS